MARFFVWACAVLAVATTLAVAVGDDSPPKAAVKTGLLTVGAAMPEFVCLDDCGQEWKSDQHVGNKLLVLYFYPGDFTDGCIRQAQAFRDGLTRLEELGVELVGISGDEVTTHKLFKETHALRHTLLADPDGALAEKLGIPVQRPVRTAKVRTRSADGKPLLDDQGKSIFIERKVTLPRWTLIIGKDGKVMSLRTKVDPTKDAEQVANLILNPEP